MGTALAVLLAVLAASAEAERRAPAELLRYLRAQTVGEGCGRAQFREPAPLAVSRHLELEGGGLLLFVQVPDYGCRTSNRAVPVVLSRGGRWRWGEPLPGAIEHLAAAPDGTLWAASQWQIEGTYPMLFRSADGLKWTAIELPPERGTTGPAETAQRLCFEGAAPVVELVEPDRPAAEWWRFGGGDAGGWFRRAADASRCVLPEPASRWRRAEGADRTVFYREGAKVSVPSRLRPR